MVILRPPLDIVQIQFQRRSAIWLMLGYYVKLKLVGKLCGFLLPTRAILSIGGSVEDILVHLEDGEADEVIAKAAAGARVQLSTDMVEEWRLPIYANDKFVIGKIFKISGRKLISEGLFSSRFLMVKLTLILYQIYISPNAAGTKGWRPKRGYKCGLPFFGNARFYVIGAGAPRRRLPLPSAMSLASVQIFKMSSRKVSCEGLFSP